MIRSCLFWIAACCIAGAASGASVETSDGRKLAGSLKLVEGTVVINIEGQPPAKVPLEQIKRLNFAPAPAENAAPAAQAGALPAPWRSTDIGTSKFPGAATFANGAFTLTASGWGFYGPEDSGHFIYQEIEGDFQIIARVTQHGPEEMPLAAGVLVRESLAADAPMAGAMRQPSGVVKSAVRPHNGWIDYAKQENTVPHPYVRVGRGGDTFSVWRSANAQNWDLVDKRNVPMGKKMLVGLAAAGLTNTYKGQATIDSVMISLTSPRASFFPDSSMPGEGVILVDGTVLAGLPKGIVNKKFKVTRPAGTDVLLEMDSVAVVMLNPTPGDVQKTLSGKRGVLLSTGDFVDGTLKQFGNNRIEVTSVLFGSKVYDAARQVMAVSLSDIEPAALQVVRTRDGSAYRCKSLTIGADQVEIESSLGKQTIAADELLAIER